MAADPLQAEEWEAHSRLSEPREGTHIHDPLPGPTQVLTHPPKVLYRHTGQSVLQTLYYEAIHPKEFHKHVNKQISQKSDTLQDQ